MNSNTKEELNRLTPRELSEITIDINNQITRALIVKAEIADALVRKSKIVALYHFHQVNYATALLQYPCDAK